MSIETLYLYISTLLFSLAVFTSARRARTFLNPFSIIAAIWVLALVNYILGLATPDFPTYYAITYRTSTFILFNALLFLVATSMIRGHQRGSFPQGSQLYVLLDSKLVFSLVFCGVLLAALMLLQKNGWRPPVIILNESSRQRAGLGYSDLDIPFVTPFSFGLQRFMVVFLAADWALSGSKLRAHFRTRRLEYLLTITATALILMSGRRNPAFTLFAIFLFSYLVNNQFTKSQLRSFTLGLAVFAFLFGATYEYRLGGDTKVIYEDLNYTVEFPVLGTIANNLINYTAPIIPNINATIENFSDNQTYGLILASEVIPDVLLRPFFHIPEQTIQVLKDQRALPFFGNTFRTYLSDLYPDFGYPGTIIIGNAILFLCVFIHNRASLGRDFLFIYLAIIPGLLFSPFLNWFTGIVSLSSLLIYFLIRRKKYTEIV